MVRIAKGLLGFLFFGLLIASEFACSRNAVSNLIKSKAKVTRETQGTEQRSEVANGNLTSPASDKGDSTYIVGAAQRDITGPAAGLGTLGYAAPVPLTNGIRQRLRVRAFVIGEANHLNRVAIAVLDTAFISGAIKQMVVAGLRKELGDKFDNANVLLTATHTHSAPGGYSNNRYYNIPFRGVSKDNLSILVSGTVEAILAAYAGAEPARISAAKGPLPGVNINRSILAYMNNPEEERRQFASTTDEEMFQLRFDTLAGRPLGVLNWFAVHGTSVEKDNGLINGDNKGYAAYAFEKKMGTTYLQDGEFVAAFASKASGDASPNIAKDVDGDGDWDCLANENWTCARESGELQAIAAIALFETPGAPVTGGISFRHSFVNMANQVISDASRHGESPATTCPSAIGLAMFAGSEEDGPGIGKEGRACSKSGPVSKVRCKQFPCQGEKVVALDTGTKPEPWVENVMPLQILRVGTIAIVGGPGEFTTMAGRRLTSSVHNVLGAKGVSQTVLTGYSNEYAGYTTTREEYQYQHYEGGHTVFGEWQLAAYQQNFERIARDLIAETESESIGAPPVRVESFGNAKSKTGDDSSGTFKFGQILLDTAPSYRPGQKVTVKFAGANPNNNMNIGKTFLEVQRKVDSGWVTVARDWDWDTAFIWQDNGSNKSVVTLEWYPPNTINEATYRIVYHGSARKRSKMTSFTGFSTEFNIRR